eukprot:gb/GEZN01013592.1/.p1 GENE.gb/GEZN01013592.1/~~gb/GEZN01013592.1/.p1  ORF type:complete len:245 (-),score=26.10 gb/GEZN01013592.1/:204-938(-)
MGRSVLQWMSSGLGDPLMKKVVSILVIAFSIYWGYRRIKRAQEADRLRQNQRNAQVSSATDRSSSRVSSASSSTIARATSPAQYLRPHTPARKVCLSIEKTLFRDGFQHAPDEEAVSILFALLRSTQLFLVCLCTDKDTETSVMKALNKTGLFNAGLKKHRVLFCTTQKGKIAMFRHLEPDLCLDEDAQVIAALRSHIPSTAWISAECPTELRSSLASPSLPAYFALGSNDVNKVFSPVFESSS